jgi:hypothetical protein
MKQDNSYQKRLNGSMTNNDAGSQHGSVPSGTNSSVWIRTYSEACLSQKHPGTSDVYQRVLRDFLLWFSPQPGHLSSHLDQLTRTTVEIYLTSLEEAG